MEPREVPADDQTNRSIDAVRREDALAAMKPQAEDIASIEVQTYRFAAAMRAVDPPNSFGARYSLPHAAAALILRGNLGNGSFLDAVVRDPAVSALRRRVQVTEDPTMTAALPARKPARVTLTLKDGPRSTHHCDEPRRDAQRPYEESDIRGKFRELAGHVLTRKGVEAIEQSLDQADRWDGIEPLIALLRSHGRPAAVTGPSTASF